MDLVRLTLETKLLQWKNEELPIIPQLIEKHSIATGSDNQSLLLDLWRLWEKETDLFSLDCRPSDLLRLTEEAEAMIWDSKKENHLQELSQLDDSINSSLINSVMTKLKEMQDVNLESCSEDIDVDDIDRLQQEAFLLWPVLFLFCCKYISVFR